MAKASIATSGEQQRYGSDSLAFQPGNIELAITSADARGLMADAYIWRAHVHGMLALVEFVAEHAVREPGIAYAIENTIGGARVLSEMAEATLQRACDVLGVDYDGTEPAGNA